VSEVCLSAMERGWGGDVSCHVAWVAARGGMTTSSSIDSSVAEGIPQQKGDRADVCSLHSSGSGKNYKDNKPGGIAVHFHGWTSASA